MMTALLMLTSQKYKIKQYKNGEAAYTEVQRGVDLFGRWGTGRTKSS